MYDNTVVRSDPPLAGAEREMLAGFLDYHRATILQKISGVSGEDLKRPSSPPSTLTLLGLLKHLAVNEQWWFQVQFAGREVTFVEIEGDPDPEMRIEPGETAASIATFYQAEVEKSRQIVSAASLDDLSAGTSRSGEKFSLRWIILHMIEETARHNGHADFLRQAIDGATGE